MAKKGADSGSEADMRARARERLRRGGHTEFDSTAPPDIYAVLEELQVHQFELQVQNDELYGTQAALAESRDRYRKLYDAAPVGYMSLEHEQIAELNRTACEILGYTRENALDMPFVHFIAPESLDTYYRHRQAVEASTETHTCELTLHNIAGERWQISLESSAVYAERPGQCNCALADITDRKRAESRARQLEQDFMSATDQERSRISRELHDSVSQQIAAMIMFAHGIEQRLAQQASPEAEAVAKVGRELQEAAGELRTVIYDLAPPELSQNDLGIALTQLAAETDRNPGLACSCSGCDSIRGVDPQTGYQLLRIAREAIHNACKHGAPTRVDIVLRRVEGALELSVEDDGCGIPSPRAEQGEIPDPEGLGLRSMRYRAHLIGADLHIGARPDGGTIVRGTLPP